MQNQELAHRIVQDHDKLDRTFTDLERTFTDLKDDNFDRRQDHELLEDARADLNFALEEMLEHFGVEEEAIFQHLRQALPDLSERLDGLEEGHEALCSRVTQLRKMVAAAEAGLKTFDPAAALESLQQMRRILSLHNNAEVQLFLEALERLDGDDQRILRENLEQL